MAPSKPARAAAPPAGHARMAEALLPPLPARLLLATDLSMRCDRAIDRAVQLAGDWSAELDIMTVVETADRPDPLAVLSWPPADDKATRLHQARRQLQRDTRGLVLPARLHVAYGPAAAAIGRTAAELDCGLIVVGVGRNESFGRFLLGSTIEQLARSLPQPVLVVRSRVHGDYRRVLVATDFSPAARHALRTAAGLFADCDLTLYHAYTAPYGRVADLPIGRDSMRQLIEDGECAAFLAGCALPGELQSRLRLVLEGKGLEMALGRYVRDHDIDLVVLGTQGRSGLMNLLLGSSAARLLGWLPCDTLVVRQPRD